MTSIVLEIRDRATLIPVIAINLFHHKDELELQNYGETYAEEAMALHAGFSPTSLCSTIIVRLDPVAALADVYNEPNLRLRKGYRYIQEHFTELTSGDVVDIEYISNETSSPKPSAFLNRK